MRIASGVVLFAYTFLHFTNLGLGLISSEAMDAFQDVRRAITRSLVGSVVVYGALLIHGFLAIWNIASRHTLRMPLWEALQLCLGLIIPLLLVDHVVFTRLAHEYYDVNDRFGYLVGLIWGTRDGVQQNLLMVIVWCHGCIGMHFWLAGQAWWHRWLPTLTGLAAIVPVLAVAGYLTEGRRVSALLADPEVNGTYYDLYNWPTREVFGALIGTASTVWTLVVASLVLAGVGYLLRKFLSGRRSVKITYVDGPEILAPKGPTLLEMSRAAGIPHTSLCGGRGRCTTCRVIVEQGAEHLHPPSTAESRSLKAVNAPPNARLACQIRPTNPATVFRVFQPDGQRGRAHATQGMERKLALLFLDMRGFTARTTGQLPYDVVFLLNRFFDAIVPEITGAGGTVDKYLGDGLMAVFEADDPVRSARASLRAVRGIGEALKSFNAGLVAEGEEPVRIGIGVHMGDVVIGEIGAIGNAPRTLIGATVNAASRLEGQTKELSVQALISDAVLRDAGYDLTELDLVSLHLRGVREPLDALALDDCTLLPALPETEPHQVGVAEPA